MSWQKEVDEITRRKALAQRMGGPENVSRHHRAGRLTARERIDLLVDEGSFREYGALAGQAVYDEQNNLVGFTPANVVIGSARLNGRRVVVSAEDFTVRGGSSEATRSEKWIWAETLALEMGQPLIRLVDTAGGSVKLLDSMGATKLPGYASWRFSELLGAVPVVGVALGSVAGLGAFRVVTAHFSIMTRETSQVFAAGPPLVTPASGETFSKEELGGYRIHTRGSGVVDNEAADETDALGQVRRFLSYLPSNVQQTPPRIQSEDPADRREQELLEIIPRDRKKTYDARLLASLIFDQDSLFEIGKHQGRSVIALLGRLNGYAVGVMASDTRFFGGGMDHTAAEKIIRFVDMCDTFHLPMVNLFDQPGVVIGQAAEKAGTIRIATRALQAIAQSRVPWVAVILRRAFGVAGSAYGRQHDLNLRYAWPSARWGSLPIEGGIEAAYKREIEQAPDPAAFKKKLETHYEGLQSPFRTAERFGITDIIDPRDTRPILCDWVEQAYQVLPGQIGPKARTMRI
ncbi:MAG: carboxyl transferase domain-containing protein [Desulfarculaceae bacterium]|jgi:acetyl-CoA carboxylase carboxyltransferase component